MFLEFLAAENLENTIPAPLCLCRGMGSRQFRAGIVFLEFIAAANLKNTIPAPLCRGSRQFRAGIVFLEF